MVTKLSTTVVQTNKNQTPVFTGINVGEDNLTVYDEGTWTPVVKIGSTDITTAGSTYGKFTRIGNVVHLTCRAYFNRGTNSGTLSIEGLPVASASGTVCALAIRVDNNIDTTPPLGASVNDASSVIALYVQPDSTSGTLTGMSDSQVPASTAVNMTITGFYFA